MCKVTKEIGLQVRMPAVTPGPRKRWKGKVNRGKNEDPPCPSARDTAGMIANTTDELHMRQNAEKIDFQTSGCVPETHRRPVHKKENVKRKRGGIRTPYLTE